MHSAMHTQATPLHDFSHIRPLLLDVARERSADRILDLITARLAEVDNIAIARIWLVGPSERCHRCRRGQMPADPDRALHLVAEAVDPRFAVRASVPIQHEGDHVVFGELAELDSDTEIVRQLRPWDDRPHWASEHGCRGLARQPLLFHEELLGVCEVMTWVDVAPGGPEWLRVIADHAAAALANSRAFNEIQRLRERLALENDRLREEIRETRSFGDIIGESPALIRVHDQVELVAPTETRVLLLGESGTGKELVAREIHRRGARKDQPMVRVNCASIPSSLYESEFFGHVRGAFTGAVADRAGRFELADGGTLFLDEIGELPLEMQSKLLRVLQEGHYERVGDSRTREVDVRLIAATNRDLEAEVRAGRFREDLYYRINVFPIHLPPLRERHGDISLLLRHFARATCERLGRPEPRWSDAILDALENYAWPGNVRELQNVVERAVILGRNGELRFDFLGELAGTSLEPATGADATARIWTAREIERFERENRERALSACKGRIFGAGGAAELLGVNPNTLASRMRRERLRG